MADSPRFRVLVSDKLSGRGLDILRSEPDLAVDVRTGMPESDLIGCIGAYDALVIRSGTRVTAPVLRAATRLKVVGRAGIGVDNVDLAAATERGVVVMNTPGGNTITTAEHTIALLFSLVRDIPAACAAVKAGQWPKGGFMGSELYGKTLGLIGLGRIGSVVAQRMAAFHMKVIAHDPFIPQERAAELGVEMVGLADLFSRADIISLHTPLTDKTRGIIGREALAAMKTGVRIVNCARGGLVDAAALLEALQSGRVAGAALDVLPEEPPAAGDPLVAHPRVIVTPHLGASTHEAQENVAVDVAEQIRDYLLRGLIRNAVNVPAMPAELAEKARPWLALAEALGAFLMQVSDGAASELRVTCVGEIGAACGQALSLAALKGVLEPVTQHVNMVNAPVVARARGLRMTETIEPAGDFANFIRLTLRTENGARTVGGTVLRQADARLISLDEYFLEARPTAVMLVVINRDEPGAIGRIGTILGEHGVNVADMHLGCLVKHRSAASIYNLDQDMPEAALALIRALPMVTDARVVHLPADLFPAGS